MDTARSAVNLWKVYNKLEQFASIFIKKLA